MSRCCLGGSAGGHDPRCDEAPGEREHVDECEGDKCDGMIPSGDPPARFFCECWCHEGHDADDEGRDPRDFDDRDEPKNFTDHADAAERAFHQDVARRLK